MTFRQVFRIVLAISVSILALVIAAFVQTQRVGQEVTSENAVWYQLLSLTLWTGLGLSVVVSVLGFATRRSQPFALAAVLSATFSFFAILSIGLFTLILTVAQLAAASTYARTRQAD